MQQKEEKKNSQCAQREAWIIFALFFFVFNAAHVCTSRRLPATQPFIYSFIHPFIRSNKATLRGRSSATRSLHNKKKARRVRLP